MKVAKPLITIAGFLTGFSAVAIWYYLNWAPLSWAVFAGVAVAILFSVLWVIPGVSRTMRSLAVASLALLVVAYAIIVVRILVTSECGAEDGYLYCHVRGF